MKNFSRKIISLAVAIFSCFALVFGIGFSVKLIDGKNNASASVSDVSYYKSKLSGTDLIFYNALEEMLSSGKLKRGESYEITDTSVIALAGQYVSGDLALLRSFGASIDSFKFDHPEVFYVDYDMLIISVGLRGNEYVVSIGSGRTDTYFVNGITSENVDLMIQKFNTELETLTSGISGTTAEKAREVNKRIISKVSYGFGSNDDGTLSEKAPLIRTAYGALVNGESVCAGYAYLFKSAMDKLGENVILVSGYAIDGSRVEPHIWNYVNVDEKWYGVDVTWNDGEWSNISSSEKYLLADKTAMDFEHLPDSVISSSEYNMPYPELCSGLEHIIDGKFEVERFIDKTGSGGDYLNVSYDGKGATELAKEGLYLAYRNKNGEDWSAWFTFEYSAYAFAGLFENNEGYSKVYGYALNGLTVSSYQIAVISKKPDLIVANSFPVIDGQKVEIYSHYSNVSSDDILCLTDEYFNENYDETYVAPPYVKSVTPENFFQAGQIIKTHHITVTYDQKLKINDGSSVVKMNFSYNAKNGREIVDSEIRKYAKIENVVFDGESTISFDFTPSSMFMHNDILYVLYFENLVGDVEGKTGKAPNSFGTSFTHPSTSCASYVYSGNCKSMDVYAQPLLIGNDDLSLEGWSYIDKDGNKKMASQNQISQLALVVTKPYDESEIKDELNNLAGEDAVLKAETYDINLNLCGGFTYIPNGLSVKISLGFPAGYSAKDKGVTFKVYHFKRNDDGTIDYSKTQEVDCVVTEYGLVITVDNFSPFAIVALDSSKVQTTKKGIVTNFNGVGGSVSNSLSNSSVNFVEKDRSITYSFNAFDGYEIDYVVLNGKKQNVEDNKLTLTYADLNENNTLDVGFVSTKVVSSEKENGIKDLTSSYFETETEHTHTSSIPAKDCKHRQICEVCGEEFGEYGEHKIVVDPYKAPTCKETGLTIGSHCSLCGKIIVEQRVIEKTDHNFVADSPVPATCTSTGLTAGTHCSVCGTIGIEQKIVPMLDHIDENGDHKCDNCGKVLEHTHESKTPATCKQRQVCEICGEEFGELASHKIVTDAPVKATCISTGLTAGTHCSVCGFVEVAQREIPKTDHIDENHDRLCDVCGETVECKHYSSVPATCLKRQVCDYCHEEFGELGLHTIVVDQYKAPTCEENGKTEGSHCSVCGFVEVAQKEIEKLNHIDENGDYKCDRCEKILEHTHESKTPATCKQRQICEICGEEFGEYAEHTIVIDGAVPATCESYGKTMGSHCSVCGKVIVEQRLTEKAPHTDLDGDNRCDKCGSKVSEINEDEDKNSGLSNKNIVLIVVSAIAFVVVLAFVGVIIKGVVKSKKKE